MNDKKGFLSEVNLFQEHLELLPIETDFLLFKIKEMNQVEHQTVGLKTEILPWLNLQQEMFSLEGLIVC
jgi:hypothetical protein